MNVLLVNPSFRKWGGVEEVLVLLANHLLKVGHRVIVASQDTSASLEGRLPRAVPHYNLPLRAKAPLPALRNSLGLLKIARHERIDLISSHQKKTTVVSLPVGWWLGIPVVHSGHNQMGDWRARWFGYLGKNLVANCQTTRDYLAQTFSASHEDIAVIYDTPSLPIVPRAEEIERVRVEFGLLPDQPVLVCFGRLSDEKGHHVLFRALPDVRRRFPNVRLLVVGKGHLRRKLEQFACSLGLEDCIAFTGYRQDARAIVAAATLAIHPALVDAFPLTIIECMALGVPVVASDVQGIPEAVRHGDTGILVPPNDPSALAASICDVLSDLGAAHARARRAEEFVRRRFDGHVMCEDYERYFHEVLKRSKPAVPVARDVQV